jgi:hypothetical protein
MTYDGVCGNDMAFFYFVVVVFVRCDGCAEEQCRCGNCGGPDLHLVVCLLKPDRDSTGSRRQVVQERCRRREWGV